MFHLSSKQSTLFHNMNSTTENAPVRLDFHKDYTAWQKTLYMASQMLCAALTGLLNFGIIWYENNVSDNRRTLINKMVAITSL